MTIEDIYTQDEIKKLESIKRRLNKIAKELDSLDASLFGWNGSGCIIHYDDRARGGAYKIADLKIKINGGDPDYEAI